MSREEQDQQVICKYLFIITPIEIKSNSKLKTNNKKAILIKLGNKTAKCVQMNTSLELEIDVLYSKTLQKYCPIKGIIKIYDVSEDGTQIISCVGGFQTDEFLNQAKTHVLIEKDIGTSKLKMEINITNKSGNIFSTKHETIQKQKVAAETQKQVEKPVMNNDKLYSVKNSRSSQQRSILSQGFFVPERRVNALLTKPIEIPHKNTSNNINKSLQKINQALNFKRKEDQSSSKACQVLLKSEVETIKHQLAQEKKKNSYLQQKFNKTTQKLTKAKTILQQYQKQLRQYREIQDKFINTLELKNAFPHFEMKQDTLKLQISCKYIQAGQIFRQFMEILIRKNSEPLPFLQLDLQGIEVDRSLTDFQQTKKQLVILKKLTMQKDKKIFSLQKQLQGMQKTIHNLKEANKHVNEENQYLREKNDQVEMNLYHKESAIDSLKKQLEQFDFQLQEVEGKLYNAGLENEELKEEVSNCNETIEKYREKYGDLKNVKNRAIQFEIKQCIRWLDLQNRDLEISDMEETAEHRDRDENDSWSSVIRNIEIEKVPIEEMSVIRNELLRILQKVDNLMSK